MKLRPCIDIHNGKVKQIVGASLQDMGDSASENFVSERGADFYARMYRELGLSGGHIILLNPTDSPYYDLTRQQGLAALSATPGLLQIGGGINADNAAEYLDAGATHVIVTSYVFSGGRINHTNLKRLVKAVGREHIVLDLSCKKKDADYFVVTDRWQKFTSLNLTAEAMDELSEFCDEFLVHAADVEGQQQGIEEDVVRILSSWAKKPVTYAGGIRDLRDIENLKKIGKGKLDVTVGSALKIFGGPLAIEDVIASCK